MAIIATVRSAGGLAELAALVLSFVVLLPVLVMFGFFLFGFAEKGKTRSSRLFRVGVCGGVAVWLICSLLSSARPPRQGCPVGAHTHAEFQSIKSAITAFKTDFKVTPPSLIYLCEDPDGWRSELQSRARLKYLWPSFNFALARDLNRDGDTEDRIVVDGAECLVLFLGGVADPLTGELLGFSKNPADPFSIDNGTRRGPFYDFERDRLIDLDGDGFFEYSDRFHGRREPDESLFVPYVYLSSYDGDGYRQEDVEALSHISDNPLTRWYLKSEEEAPHFPDRFQIVSAGLDGLFRAGGVVEQFPEPAWYESERERGPQFDNLTNFHSGLLGRKEL